jgi:hypothetical protein
MMAYSILEITNGTTTVSLIHLAGGMGIHLSNWSAATADLKDGGTWKNPIMGDGRSLVMRRWSNTLETFDLDVSGYSQDDAIEFTQNLRRLLEQARDYWKPRATVGPVWIKAQSNCETNVRYAYIYDGRAPNDNGPYSSGFEAAQPMLSDWTLVVERGHWQSDEPGTISCLEASSAETAYTYGANLVLNGSFETAGGGGADVFANWTENAGSGSIQRDLATVYPVLGGAASCRLIGGVSQDTWVSQNIAVTAGQVYAFSFKYFMTGNPNYMRASILNATAGGTVIHSVEQTAQLLNLWSAYSIFVTIPAGCASATVRFDAPPSTVNIYIDLVSLNLATPFTIGRSSTCEREMFLANKYSPVQLTNIYRYDASVPSFSANLVNAARPFDLLPNPAAAGDILYLGVDDSLAFPGAFTNAVFDIAQAAVGVAAGVWELWTGAAWVSFAAAGSFTADTTDDSSSRPLMATGVGAFSFMPVAAWTRTTINGVYGYWIRYRVTSIVSGAPRPQQQNRPIYTSNQPGATLAAADLLGDITLLSRASVALLDHGVNSPIAWDLILATRTVSRGSSFSPFLNFTNVQEDPYISYVGLGVALTVNHAPQSPTGVSAIFSVGVGGDSAVATIRISSPRAAEYFGAYRIFGRFQWQSGAVSSTRVTLTVRAVGTTVSETFTLPGFGTGDIVDFGKFVIPSVVIDQTDQINFIQFDLDIVSSVAQTFVLQDLVLVPIDECAIELIDSNSGSNTIFTDDNGVMLDSMLPKTMLRTNVQELSTEIIYYAGSFRIIGGSPFQLEPNRDQWLYIFVLKTTHLFSVANPKLYAVSRYLSMRGSR